MSRPVLAMSTVMERASAMMSTTDIMSAAPLMNAFTKRALGHAADDADDKSHEQEPRGGLVEVPAAQRHAGQEATTRPG